MAEGPHLVEAAVNAGTGLKRLFVTAEFARKEGSARLLERASRAGAELYELSARAMKKISDAKTPQGISALCSYTPAALDGIKFREAPLIVVSDGISEPGNLGALIRTADAFGADAVALLPGTCDPFSPKALRATAGSVFSIQLIIESSTVLFPWLMERGILTAAATPRAKQTIGEVGLKAPVALIFGNESEGLDRDVMKATDVRFRIPTPGRAESLNVAASAAVCLYEVQRQRAEDV